MTAPSHAIPNEWLALYYDGELDAQRRAQVEAHLAICVACQRELAALKTLSDVLAVDQLSQDALVNQSARAAWHELEPRLRERTASAPSLLRWLPGIGLVMATAVVQFIAAASVVVMFAVGQLGWIAPAVDAVNRVLSDWLLGWFAWLLPGDWSGWGLPLFLVIVSGWLAVLYLIWMGYIWLEQRQPLVQNQNVLG